MKIYDEITKEEIFNPDLSLGYLYYDKKQIGVEEEKTIILEGTITERNPSGLSQYIPSHPIYEECQYYHKYTETELNPPKTDYATWSELAEAYKKGVELA